MRQSKILRGAFALVLTVALAIGLGTAAFAVDTSFGFSVGDTMQTKEVILKSRDNSDINIEISKLEKLKELWDEIGGKKMADAVAQDRSMNDPKCTRENLEENGESKVVFTTGSPTIVVVPSEV